METHSHCVMSLHHYGIHSTERWLMAEGKVVPTFLVTKSQPSAVDWEKKNPHIFSL